MYRPLRLYHLRARRLRGGPLDIFGRTAERKWERRLLAEYEVILDEVLADVAFP